MDGRQEHVRRQMEMKLEKGGRDEITKGDTEPYEGVTRETE